MAGEGGKRWLMYGCFGCLGLVGIFVLAVAGMFGIAAIQARSEKVEEQVLTHDVPVAGTSAEILAPPSEAPAGTPPVSSEFPADQTGQVILRLSHAGFFLEPAAPGEPLRVEAKYDTKSYELEEDFQAPEGSGWIYRVSFRSKGGSFFSGLREMLGGTSPKVRIFLPPDVPISLDVRLTQGASEAELGGLWLTEADINVTQGGIELGVSRPLRAPMERLSIRASMGGGEIESLGNASPRELDVEMSMGGMNLDLRGQWLQDSNISIESSMGGAAVWLPKDVNVRGVDTGRFDVGPEPEVGRPTLTFSVDAQMGGVDFID